MLAGARPDDIASALGLARATVYGWRASYRIGGQQALTSRSIPGRPPALSPARKQRLWTLIIDSDPREQQFDSALWTVRLVRTLICREFGITLSPVTVRRLMLKMGISAHRAHPRGDGGDAARERWQSEWLPACRAQAEGAAVYFGDEKVLHPGTGQPDVVTARLGSEPAGTPHWPQATVISAAPARGGPCFAAYRGPSTAAAFTDFCARLLHDVPGVVYLVMDSRPGYREPSVGDFAISDAHRLRLFFPPRYPHEPGPAVTAAAPTA